MNDKKMFVGIDFGTSNSSCCVFLNNDNEVLTYGQDKHLLPSVVGKTKDGFVVGASALRNKKCLPIRNVKRLIGKQYDMVYPEDSEDKHSQDVKLYGARIVKGSDGYCCFEIEGEQYTCLDIATKIFEEIFEAVKKKESEVEHTVISVPANYRYHQRVLIREAAEKAGFKVWKLINEPTAAVVAYASTEGYEYTTKNILVFDLGGGTLDVTILQLNKGSFSVLATCGDDNLGGNNFTLELVSMVEDIYQQKHGRSLYDGVKKGSLDRFKQRLMSQAEEVKIQLSSNIQVDFPIPEIGRNDECEDNLIDITRAGYEFRVQGLLERCLNIAKQAMNKADCTTEQIEEVIFVGGGALMPCIQTYIANSGVGKRVCQLSCGKEMEIVCMGCCDCAHKIDHDNFHLFEKLHTSFGIVVDENNVYPIFQEGEDIPCPPKEVTLYCNGEGCTCFQAPLVEIHPGENFEDHEKILLHSSDFQISPNGSKELRFIFSVNDESVLKVETYAMPENELCLTKLFNHFSSFHVV